MALKIDLGCGPKKREGFVGVDLLSAPGVDHVLDLTRERLPFEDASVEHVFSSHFFEHVKDPSFAMREIGRVAQDGARVEIWTPYAFTREAFLYGHETFFTELVWEHFCGPHREHHLESSLGGVWWQLREVVFVVREGTAASLAEMNIPLSFALRHMVNIAEEMGVFVDICRDLEQPPAQHKRLWAHSRDGERHELV